VTSTGYMLRNFKFYKTAIIKPFGTVPSHGPRYLILQLDSTPSQHNKTEEITRISGETTTSSKKTSHSVALSR